MHITACPLPQDIYCETTLGFSTKMNNQYVNNEQPLNVITQGLYVYSLKVLSTSEISNKELRNCHDVLIRAGNMHGHLKIFVWKFQMTMWDFVQIVESIIFQHENNVPMRFGLILLSTKAMENMEINGEDSLTSEDLETAASDLSTLVIGCYLKSQFSAFSQLFGDLSSSIPISILILRTLPVQLFQDLLVNFSNSVCRLILLMLYE